MSLFKQRTTLERIREARKHAAPQLATARAFGVGALIDELFDALEEIAADVAALKGEGSGDAETTT